MKQVLILALLSLALFSGCQRNSSDVWEDTKTAGRHVSLGFRSLGGKHGDSRQVMSRDEFICCDNEFVPTNEWDYIPLNDQERPQEAFSRTFQQVKENPGDPGSAIPGIDGFKDPSAVADTGFAFEEIYFDYNSNQVKSDKQLQALRKSAVYLQSHPNTYAFIAGHCDERGPEAYNLALGSRRANTIRNILIQEGVDPGKLFTISYGKERPRVLGHNEAAWRENRRAEFKLYQR